MLSAFTGFGNLEFSSKPPRAQSIYESLVSMNGGNFDDNFSGPINAEWYAIAMAAGCARDTLERVENQADPETVHEMLPVQESMYGLSPGPFDSTNARRAALAARYAVARRPTLPNVTQALRLLLGEDFVAWVPNPVATPSPAAIPADKCKAATARFKTLRLLDNVTSVGSQRVRYTPLDGDATDLQDRETVVIDPGLSGIEELITVIGPRDGVKILATDPDPVGAFTATFANAHAAGAVGITSAWPNWSSYKKHSLVIVKNGRATDPILRAKVTDLLSRMLSGSSTWDVVQENTTPGTCGPFRVGEPGIGIVPIGAASYVSL